ncbi:aminoglycoside 6-adenylyltransferase [Paenibacillus sp. KS-LC4]|uniref:aminoglycoside 6-adenylyltransferase n=1 Tax=Paenibacillus sp. KS-LC4 TaxID=2979727 RepID=UPI0030D51B70
MVDLYKNLEQRIVSWAGGNEDIQAMYLMGSRARADKPFDEFSDLDIVIYSTNPDYYFETNDWLLNIGEVWTSFMYRTAGGDPEKLVLFDEGLQVDFLFCPNAELERLAAGRQVPQGFKRGVKLLLDKTGKGEKLLPKTAVPDLPPPITEAAFQQVVNQYGFACLYVAKQILRGELWVAGERDHACKQLLLQMLEWHAKAIHGPNYDTWHAGKFIAEWADAAVIADLKQAFGGFDQLASWKALNVSFELFSRLSLETAQVHHYDYPHSLYGNIKAWLQARQLVKNK